MAKKLTRADIEFSLQYLEYQRGWYDDPDWQKKIDEIEADYKKRLENLK